MRLSLKKGAHVGLSRAAYRKSGQSTGAPSFAFFAKGGIVRSHPLTSHGKQTCSLGDLGISARASLLKSETWATHLILVPAIFNFSVGRLWRG
jgi:hypothetical protein